LKIKALSFRQPWAELVIQGAKTIDLRTWKTNYRGPLAVYASQTIEKEACRDYELDDDHLTTGAIIGVVDLIDVIKLDETMYAKKSPEHLNARSFREPMYAWEISKPYRLPEPKPVRGRLNLFDVELEPEGLGDESSGNELTRTEPKSSTIFKPIWGDSTKPFELRVVPENGPEWSQRPYRLALYQRMVEPPSVQRSLYRQNPQQMERVVELGGNNLRAVSDQVLEALRASGYKVTDLSATRKDPFALDEEWGVRLGLLFLAIKPISKTNRIEAISFGIRQMTSEELYYWYSKCTHISSADRAQKAIRILLSDE
jgi:hypothetical protein